MKHHFASIDSHSFGIERRKSFSNFVGVDEFFALEHFGAIMGQREGRQGQSYAIPTIGGTIDKKELKDSVMRFTQYAIEHPELKFLVTPVGCGGGGWRPSIVAPMFREASALSNVYLPLLFWENI